MGETYTVELDESFIRKFFEVTDDLEPDEITLQVLKKQLLNIENQANKLKEVLEMDPKKPKAKQQRLKELREEAENKAASHQSGPSKTKQPIVDENFKGKVLIIDDLGVITYQLSTMLKRMDFECMTSNDIVGAIELFKKNHFDFVLMDLFIPTQREGFILLEELKKLSNAKEYKTIIGVMTASNKKEHKVACTQYGADFFLEKVDTWQQDLCKQINEYES